eukprot:2572445-Prymnesium_polylepis.1
MLRVDAVDDRPRRRVAAASIEEGAARTRGAEHDLTDGGHLVDLEGGDVRKDGLVHDRGTVVLQGGDRAAVGLGATLPLAQADAHRVLEVLGLGALLL